MKHTATVLLMTIVAITLTCAAFAENLRSIPVELTLGGDVTTSFEVYADAGLTTPLSELTLSDGGYTINDNVKYIAGEAYLNITYGNTGRWYFLIYTSNDIPWHGEFDYQGGFISNQANNLLSTDGSHASLCWKYNNPLRLGKEQGEVGDIISGAFRGEESMYVFMLNIPPGKTPYDIEINDYETRHDVLRWASIVCYSDSNCFSYFMPIRITFGVDLASSCRATTYTSTLNFEVYYE
ncbi:MAG: hypothetical protein RBU23_03130 [Candidatus Auribacterota bacterium]|jgi:hypothetical protein|nr:hypothetical protein [Candidatus Auribacterota bacterium]